MAPLHWPEVHEARASRRAMDQATLAEPDSSLSSLTSLLLARAAAGAGARPSRLDGRQSFHRQGPASRFTEAVRLRFSALAAAPSAAAPPLAWRSLAAHAAQPPSSPPPLAPASDSEMSDEEEDDWGDIPALVEDWPSSQSSGEDVDDLSMADPFCPWGGNDGLARVLMGGPPAQTFSRASRATLAVGARDDGPYGAAPRNIHSAAVPSSTAAPLTLEAELASVASKVVALSTAHAAQLADAHPRIRSDLQAVANQLHSIMSALAAGPPQPA